MSSSWLSLTAIMTSRACGRSGILAFCDQQNSPPDIGVAGLDFLLTPAPVEMCRDLLEVVEDRAQRRSTLVVSQLPVEHWHQAMADPTLGEAILDRVLQASYRIALKGPSRRRRDPEPAAGDPS